MDRIIIAIVFLIVTFGLFSVIKNNKEGSIKGTLNKKIIPQKSNVLSASSNKKPARNASKRDAGGEESLFVPYWALTQDEIPAENYDNFIYFGIAANENGIDKNEPGFMGIPRFVKTSSALKNKLLVVRMLNYDSNFKVLKDKNLQQKIIDQTNYIIKQYGFEGVVLDLEVSSLPFASVTNQITDFTESFYKAAKKENKTFSIMLFGDTFYRLRSYDVFSLVENTDKIYVMAYDFHKAGGGNPGPNFPLSGKETYGYDFKSMVNDFLNIVPAEKLSIVFGMFGYDWTLDENGKSMGQAKSVSLFYIKEKFINNCLYSSCVVKREEQSAETKITYKDSENKNHLVWFEDEKSVSAKQSFLKEKGINSVGFWAYSYF